MGETRNPDFIGRWEDPKNPDLGVTGFFKMFILEGPRNLRELESYMKDVSGTIFDDYGEATFKGHISLEAIAIKKQYTPEAIKKGANKNEMEYLGSRLKTLSEEIAYNGEYVLSSGARRPFSMVQF